MIINPPKPIFVDIETSLMTFYSFRLGDQHLNHGQMTKIQVTDIICITYCFEKGPGHCLRWDVTKGEDSSKIIKEFDEIMRSDNYYVIGQNSDSFDIKHINTIRLMNNLPPFPEWADMSDDTLKQVKKHFKFPTNKLDFTSSLFGLGGKTKMEMSDWIDIHQYIVACQIINEIGKATTKKMIGILYDRDLETILKEGKKSLDKMCRYGTKDVTDTRAYFNRIKPYVIPKINRAAYSDKRACTVCGSDKVTKGTKYTSSGGALHQYFNCNAGNGHTCAGKATYNIKKETWGKMLAVGK